MIFFLFLKNVSSLNSEGKMRDKKGTAFSEFVTSKTKIGISSINPMPIFTNARGASFYFAVQLNLCTYILLFFKMYNICLSQTHF